MAGLSDNQLETVRTWVGLKWPDDDIYNRYDRFFLENQDANLSLFYTTVEILRSQLAKMVQDQASSVSAEGMSQSWVTNITTLREQVAKLEGSGVDIKQGPSVTHLSRASSR